MATAQQSKLILYLIMLLGLVGGYMYNGQFDPAEALPPFPQGVAVEGLDDFRTLRVNYTILQDEQFQSLRIFGSYPVPTGAPGKNNPFQ